MIPAVITFGLSEADFLATEDEAIANVKIFKKKKITLANPVTFRITPLTVQQALDRGVIDSYPTPADENVSPSRAGELQHNFYLYVLFIHLFYRHS